MITVDDSGDGVATDVGTAVSVGVGDGGSNTAGAGVAKTVGVIVGAIVAVDDGVIVAVGLGTIVGVGVVSSEDAAVGMTVDATTVAVSVTTSGVGDIEFVAPSMPASSFSDTTGVAVGVGNRKTARGAKVAVGSGFIGSLDVELHAIMQTNNIALATIRPIIPSIVIDMVNVQGYYIVNATRFAVDPPSMPCHSANSNASLICSRG